MKSDAPSTEWACSPIARFLGADIGDSESALFLSSFDRETIHESTQSAIRSEHSHGAFHGPTNQVPLAPLSIRYSLANGEELAKVAESGMHRSAEVQTSPKSLRINVLIKVEYPLECFTNLGCKVLCIVGDPNDVTRQILTLEVKPETVQDIANLPEVEGLTWA